jgi:hypothetical protein
MWDIMKVDSKTGRSKKLLFLVLITLIVLPSLTLLFRNSLSYFQNKTAPTLKINKVVYTFENIYSDDVLHDIQDFVSNSVGEIDNFWAFDQHKLYEELKNKFNIIKSFDCRSDDQSVLNVKIVGQKPFCVVNRNQILSEDDSLFPSDFFEKFDSYVLPNINTKDFSPELCEFVHKITEYHWKSFDIDYVKSSEIRLYPKNPELRCILLSNIKTFFDQDKICKALQLYKKITTDIQLQKKLKYTKKKQLVLDVRFKSSIVARAEEEVKEEGGA